jgi:hypothetical protein
MWLIDYTVGCLPNPELRGPRRPDGKETFAHGSESSED